MSLNFNRTLLIACVAVGGVSCARVRRLPGDSDSYDAEPTRHFGGIVTFNSYDNREVKHGISATFFEAKSGAISTPSVPLATFCQAAPGTVLRGQCCYFHYGKSLTTSTRFADNQVIDSGVISTFADKRKLGDLVPTDAPDISNGYVGLNDENMPALRWNGGDVLRAKSEGGEVAAFEASLVAPSPIADLSPSLAGHESPESALAIARGTDLQLTWTPDDHVTARDRFILSGDEGTDNFGVIQCDADDADGSLLVSSDLLERFSSSGTGYFSMIRNGVSKIVETDNATVTLSASASTIAQVVYE